MTKTNKYSPGDHCWFLDGVYLSEVTIMETKTFLEGMLAEFTMHRVTGDDPRWISPSNLFLRPAEVVQLRAKIEDSKRALDWVLGEIESVVV